MIEFARPGAATLPHITIDTYSEWSVSGVARAAAGLSTPSGTLTWPAANIGVFVPVVIPTPLTFTSLYWLNGSAAGGNWDVGIFDDSGGLIVSTGSTAGTGNSVLQSVAITPTRIGRGLYYFGICCDDVTANRATGYSINAAIMQALGLLEDASCAPPLATNANPATFVAYTRAFLPLFGGQAYRTVGL